MREPQIHSHLTDVLPEEHPLAYKSLYCENCEAMLHCENNECMQTWVESGGGNFCLKCFSETRGSVLEMSDALSDFIGEKGD